MVYSSMMYSIFLVKVCGPYVVSFFIEYLNKSGNTYGETPLFKLDTKNTCFTMRLESWLCDQNEATILRSVRTHGGGLIDRLFKEEKGRQNALSCIMGDHDQHKSKF